MLGGTFDPIHVGHLRPALEARQLLALDEVRLVPCHLTPHRPQPGRASALRAEMVELAVADVPQFALDDRELQRDTPSYTVDTLQSMHDQMSDTNLYFLLGVDSLNGFERWHRWRDILSLSHLVVMRRPGYQLNDFARALVSEHRATASTAHSQRSGCIVSVDTTELRVSSTALRDLLAAGGDPMYLVPECVRRFLLARTDYQDCHD